MVEPEMAFCDLAGNMKLAEEFLKYIIQAVLADAVADLDFFQKWYRQGTVRDAGARR